MSFTELIVLLLVAGVCGSIAQSIVGVSRGGCVVAIAMGFVGSVLGMWIAREAGLPELLTIDIGGEKFPIVWSIIGAALFAAVLSFLSRGGRNL